ncbi:shikimate dehydrogenase [Arthrobacter crystallopoietes BAB-32]|uniref:Shikimate dehydrogenase n=1 Tax=Arthrobacter crystallopoietes BAB-32 TaxID=1246476 RepID=N1V4B7_9MICC|nr:shikimate dehydrogenase [Arthrobacter crystallopoietes]EMY34912.1 shikimate dehydrogenase [Arthrobacter crystallopoietes BAB-32]
MRLSSQDAAAARPVRNGHQAAVLGHPIGHSKSPALHRAAYELIGFDCSYRAIDVTPEELPGFVRSLRAEPGWAGLSVTMPLKSAMVGQMDRTSELVQVLGVLNTVVVNYDGEGRVSLFGDNTDVAGIVGALRHGGVRDGAPALILGGGGTAAAAAAALAQLNASSATVCLRDPAKAVGVRQVAAHFGLPLEVRSWDETAAAAASAATVISTLPPHGADALASLLADDPVPRAGRVLLDAAYDPWPSGIAGEWHRQGGTVVHGLEMLIYQAVEQVRLFAGERFTDAAAVTNVMCDAVGAPRR